MAPTHEIIYRDLEDLGTIRMRLQFENPASSEAEDDGGKVHHEANIQFQHGTIPENGINGVTNEAVLDLLAVRLRALNQRFPCRENSIAITHIETARLWLNERTRIRVDQGVEGQHVNHESAPMTALEEDSGIGR